MAAEYSPSLDFNLTRENLKGKVESQVEIPMQDLYEGILDVMGSRGGERWRHLDEIGLSTQAGISVRVGYDAPTDETNYHIAWIRTEEGDETAHEYEVRRWEEGGGLVHDLYEIDRETGEANAIINWGSLAPARLYSILADAHYYTPKQEFADEDYDFNP